MTFPSELDLQAYTSEHLPSFEADRVKNHLQDCLPCALRVADLKWISKNDAASSAAWGLPITMGCGGEGAPSRQAVRYALCG